MDQLTVNELLDLCKKEIKNGNGNKRIVISDDTEGNGYHGLFYGFTKNVNDFADEIYDSVSSSSDDTIILG